MPTELGGEYEVCCWEETRRTLDLTCLIPMEMQRASARGNESESVDGDLGLWEAERKLG